LRPVFIVVDFNITESFFVKLNSLLLRDCWKWLVSETRDGGPDTINKSEYLFPFLFRQKPVHFVFLSEAKASGYFGLAYAKKLADKKRSCTGKSVQLLSIYEINNRSIAYSP